MNTGDTDGDIPLALKDNRTLYWSVRDKDNQSARGMLEGFYLDDPLNSVLRSGAKILSAFASADVLVYATL